MYIQPIKRLQLINTNNLKKLIETFQDIAKDMNKLNLKLEQLKQVK
jgi:hypothetical protein